MPSVPSLAVEGGLARLPLFFPPRSEPAAFFVNMIEVCAAQSLLSARNKTVTATSAKPTSSPAPAFSTRILGSAASAPIIGMLAHRPSMEDGQPIGMAERSAPGRSVSFGLRMQTLSVEVSQ